MRNANRWFNGAAAGAGICALLWIGWQSVGRSAAKASAARAQAESLAAGEQAAAAQRAASIKPHVPQRLKVEEGMSTQGPIVVNTGADGGENVSGDWTSPANASSTSAASTAVAATLGTGGTQTNTLKCQFSAAAFSVPSTNTVSQIQVQFHAFWTGGMGTQVIRVKSVKTSLTAATDLGDLSAVTSSDAGFTYTFTGLALTSANLNGAWEIDLLFDTDNNADFANVNVYKVEATVTYAPNADLFVPSYFSLTADSGSPGGSDGWNTPTKAENAPDGIYAANNDATAGTTYLNFTQWQGSAIPDNAKVLGIKIAFFGHATGGTGSDAYDIGLIHGGASIAGTAFDKTAVNLLPAADAWSADLGDSTDLWSATLTPAIVNDLTFGVQLRCTFGAGGFVASVDSGRMTVYWSLAPIPPSADFTTAIAARYAVLNFRAPPMERIDPKVLTLPNEIEPLRVEQIMTMGVQRAPTPQRQPSLVPLMEFPDPTSFTLPNAPEPLHPEMMQPFVCLPIQPGVDRPWLAPISSEVAFDSQLSSGSAEPATFHQIDANPRRDWPRQYQPPTARDDPGEPTTRSSPLPDFMSPLSLPVRQRPTIQPPAIEVRSYATATPGDQSVYPISMTMTSNPPVGPIRRQPIPLGHPIIDAWSGQQFPIAAMYVPRAPQPRAGIVPVEVSSLAPQGFVDSSPTLCAWSVPLAQPVRERQRPQNVTLTGELGGETTDLVQATPSDWQPSSPAQHNPRPRPTQPASETVILNQVAAAVPSDWDTPHLVPGPRPTIRQAAGAAVAFADIGHENAVFLDPMAAPVRQRQRPIVSPTMSDVATTPVVGPVSFTTYDMAMPASPARQPPRVAQIPNQLTPTDRTSQTQPLIAPMDVPRGVARRPTTAHPSFPTPTDVLAGSVDFMDMAVPRPRLIPTLIVGGGSPVIAPDTLEKNLGVIEPMDTGLSARPRPVRQQPPSAALIVDAQYFAGVPDPSAYTTPWIVPRPLPRRQPVEIERTSTTSFLVGGNQPAFVGSGAVVVVAAAIWPAVRVVAGQITKSSKGV